MPVVLAAIVAGWLASVFHDNVARAWEGHRAKRAAAEFVEALSYTGSDRKEYLSEVDSTVVPPFYNSPMGQQVEKVGDSLAAYGGNAKYDLQMSAFELGEQSPMGGVSAVADVRGTEALGGGKPRDAAYRLQLRLEKGRDGWRVAYAEVDDLDKARAGTASNGDGDTGTPDPTESTNGDVATGPVTPTSDGGQTGGPTVANRESTMVDETRRRKEMKDLAARFVEAAYSYVGDDAGVYRSGVEQVVVEDTFWSSPGGQDVERLARDVRSPGGAKGRAVLTGFKVEKGETPATARVRITFDAGDEYGPEPGTVEGDVTSWRQELTLFNERGEWKVQDGESAARIADG